MEENSEQYSSNSETRPGMHIVDEVLFQFQAVSCNKGE
jgi:hypothetical protein